MEFLNSKTSFLSRPLLPSAPLIGCKTPSKLIVRRSNFRKFALNNPLYTYYSFSATKFQITARFGRRRTRENYLRKKLTQPQQHQEVSRQQNPVRDLNADYPNENTVVYDRSNILDESLDSSTGENEKIGAELSRKKQFGESIMWNKLEDWVEQYKKDAEFWGIGSGPIFNVFQNSEGKVEKVVVEEDEIFRRSRVDPRLNYETEEMDEVKYKISFAKDIAKEMENGSNRIPKHSSVAKFLVSGEKSQRISSNSSIMEGIFKGKSRIMEAITGKLSFTETISSVTLKPEVLLPRISKFGLWFFCALVVAWAARGIFSAWGDIDEEEFTSSERKMLRRKMRARAEKEKATEGTVEVMPAQIEPKCVPFGRPQLDKEELMSCIIKAKGETVDESGYENKKFRDEIEEIKIMAREAREAERRNKLQNNENAEGSQALEEFSSDDETLRNDLSIQNEVNITEPAYSTDPKNVESIADESTEKLEPQLPKISNVVVPNGSHSLKCEAGDVEKQPLKSPEMSQEDLNSDVSKVSSSRSRGSFPKKKLKIIKSAKEAREFLSRKHKTPEVKQNRVATNDLIDSISSRSNAVNDFSSLSNSSNGFQKAEKSTDETEKSSIDNQGAAASDNTEVDTVKEQRYDLRNGLSSPDDVKEQRYDLRNGLSSSDDVNGAVETEKVLALPNDHSSEDTVTDERLLDLRMPQSNDGQHIDATTKPTTPVKNENWIEKNFHEFEPVMKKMALGFRDNYQAAREKAIEGLDLVSDFRSDSGEIELEWMKDEKLREIVFKVRDNELSGRDPFHLMTEEDKTAFFGGLEKKVDKVNENLQKLHEYFHSNIENLDYGADGISLYDPPEKIMPRWKVPPAEKNPEFLNNVAAQRESFIAEGLKKSFPTTKTGEKEKPTSSDVKLTAATDLSHQVTDNSKDSSVSPRTVIEGSDGSVKAGNKNGREFWEHTKKWSQGFLESYNAETDPEVKAEMKNIGKDLDRWITEKEVQEAAELMEKLPEKGRSFINKKLEKVKREMELFGPQAVVSKYREYSDEKEEDYLWWLDLPHVLCIELYTVEDGEQRVGFYSLEMAPDLNLDPKQYHIIAFEDPRDCKNMCYIVQAHLEMLGKGNAFVVARPPKDAFREAKANGFSVTVIRKGQLQLNIDQTVEEVEESIVEIGSKIYHDKITKERGVDINALTKGVFGVCKPVKRRRSKSRSKRGIKP